MLFFLIISTKIHSFPLLLALNLLLNINGHKIMNGYNKIDEQIDED